MNLLEPSLVGLMKYVQAHAKDGDATASTLLEECLASLEHSKEQASPSPPLEPPVVGATQEAEDEDMTDDEPSVKKKRILGAGTPSAAPLPVELPSHNGAPGGESRVADASTAAASAAGAPPSPATAGAVAASEADIQEVLDQVDAGADWEVAAKKRPGRPPKQPVMPHGAMDKFVKVTPGDS
eukprot:3466370-Amphidinium_carterae.2